MLILILFVGASTSPEETKEMAKDALRSVLKKSGSESPIDAPCDGENPFSLYDSLNSDPLLNMEFSREHRTLKSNSTSDISFKYSGSKVKSLTRSQSETSNISRGNLERTNLGSLKASSEIMDKIFNESDDLLENCEFRNSSGPRKPEEIFSDSESHSIARDISLRKTQSLHGKKGHKRSRSDLGGVKTESDAANYRKPGMSAEQRVKPSSGVLNTYQKGK